MQEYDQIAEWYAETRSPQVGLPDVSSLADELAPGAHILDLGCGTGHPISHQLVHRGFKVVGLDSSADMIAKFRANLPGITARHERIQDAAFDPESFDAVIAWGVLFHLPDADQRAAISSAATWLRPGGHFLFTSGEDAGTRSGEMDGVAFSYRSLGAQTYRQLIDRAGMRLTSMHRDAWDNVVYHATRP